MTFEEEYRLLVIKQYYNKDKAIAEIDLKSETWKRVFEWFDSFGDAYDLDTTIGEQLYTIGKIVGLPRTSSFLPIGLTDEEYRFFVRLKIAVNNTSAYMDSDEFISIQDVIEQAFEGAAYVTDAQDMSLILSVEDSVDPTFIQIVRDFGLLPKPQGVQYSFVIISDTDTFGFEDDPQALGFGALQDPPLEPLVLSNGQNLDLSGGGVLEVVNGNDIFDPGIGGVFARLLI